MKAGPHTISVAPGNRAVVLVLEVTKTSRVDRWIHIDPYILDGVEIDCTPAIAEAVKLAQAKQIGLEPEKE